MGFISWLKTVRSRKRATERMASVLGGKSTKATDEWLDRLPERGSTGRGNKYSAMMKVFSMEEGDTFPPLDKNKDG